MQGIFLDELEKYVVRELGQTGLCPVATGIVRGAAKHYHVEVVIGEERCMLRGDPECVITVSAKV